MRKSLRIASMVLAALLFFSYDSLKAQVKIGGNPADIDPNAILELESSKKGFLLPRVSDMSLISASTKEGYLVYFNGIAGTPAGLFVKIGTDMVRVTTESSTGTPWKQDGNVGSGSSFLGTTGAFPLVLKANGTTGLTIGTDGKLNFGVVNPVAVGDDFNQVLIIAPDGTIQRKDLTLSSVTQLNGQKGNLEIVLAEDAAATDFAITTTAPAGAVPGKITLTIPTQAGQATYGLMHIDDYNKLQGLIAADGFVVQPSIDDPVGGLANGASFTKRSDKWDLTLAAATETTPGIVSITDQTFIGDKTFSAENTILDAVNVIIKKNSVIGGAGPANLFVEGNVALPGLAAQTLVASTNYNVLLNNATNDSVKTVSVPGWKLTGTGIGQITTSSVASPATGTTTGDLAFEVENAGTDFAISSDFDKVTFALPDASATAGSRGLVTAAAQTFGGDKSFGGKVHVGPAFGTAQTSPSSLIVNGSVGVKFRTMPSGGGTLGADDYIVLAAANAAVTPITLPDATGCAGRIYVIKRIPGTPATEDDNNLVITPNGVQTINGIASTSITVVHTSITLMSDGANWQLLSRGTGF